MLLQISRKEKQQQYYSSSLVVKCIRHTLKQTHNLSCIGIKYKEGNKGGEMRAGNKRFLTGETDRHVGTDTD